MNTTLKTLLRPLTHRDRPNHANGEHHQGDHALDQRESAYSLHRNTVLQDPHHHRVHDTTTRPVRLTVTWCITRRESTSTMVVAVAERPLG